MEIKAMIDKLRINWEAVPDLQTARKRLLQSLMVIFSVLGAPALVVGTLEAVSQGHPLSGVLYGALYLPVLLATIFSRSLSFHWQLRFLMGALYALGLSNLIVYGFNGAGIHILLTVCLLATVLRGGWAGLFTVGLSLLAILIAGTAYGLDWVSVNPEFYKISESPVAWGTALVTFLMLSLVMVVTAHLLQKFLENSLEDLNYHQTQLEALVEERTFELKQAQQEALRKERLAVLGQLAGGVAHELRNPLGVITNAVYYLKQKQELKTEDLEDYLEILDDETRNATKIISDLLSFSRQPSCQRTDVDPRRIIERVLERVPPPEQVELELHVEPALPAVLVDPDHLQQMLLNLLSNAYEALPEGGQVDVRIRQVDQTVIEQLWPEGSEPEADLWIRISVQDSGAGIPEEDLPRLFEPLFTTKARGIGLGLSVTRRLVKANGGRIVVDQTPHQGSKFNLYLQAVENRSLQSTRV